MADFTNIATGLKVPAQIPLDTKQWSLNEITLKYLGVDDNLAFTYVEGSTFYCIEDKTRWEWREVLDGEENTGLLDTDFTYPINTIAFGINYSERVFNFFPIGTAGENATITVGTVTTGAPGSNVIITNVGTETNAVLDFTIPEGDSAVINMESGITTTLNGTGSDLDPYSYEVENLQKVISVFPYTLLDTDDKHTIFVNNIATNVIIYVTDTLPDNFCAAFIQKGTGDVTFTEAGSSTLLSASGFRIKSQYSHAILEREIATDNFYLEGNIKI